jgi:hypothetical protein
MVLRLIVFASCLVAVTACGPGERVTPVVPDSGVVPRPTCLDSDGDGFAGTGDCAGEALVDCDDRNALAFPGAPEQCNGRDDSCDGAVDEGLPVVGFYRDEDGDGVGAAKVGEGCGAPPTGAVVASGDCDDADATRKPGLAEQCNGVDDDCDGTVDNGLPTQEFFVDADGDGYGAAGSTPQVSCRTSVTGSVTNSGDCNDQSPSQRPGLAEICNKVDDNCDGQVDNGIAFTAWYPDADGDGAGSASAIPEMSCAPVPGKVQSATDCDDARTTAKPGAAELCNGADDDCDGQADEGLTFTDYSPDADGDGFGASGAAVISSCLPVPGRVANAQDCNDGNGAVRPGAAEACNGVDDDCDGEADEGLPFASYYPDADGDGFGAASAQAISACAPVVGRVTNATDCNDANAAVKPLAPELCNAVDDDCDGATDEGLTFHDYYPDGDGDGFGSDTATALSSCAPVSGRVTNRTDCNDGNAAINPGRAEVCNGVDDNCSGLADEGLPTQNYYLDADNDGYGRANSTPVASCGPVSGRVTSSTDCRDLDPTAYPGAPEQCNGVDDDCDGTVDDGVATLDYWVDGDGDGFGASGTTPIASCSAITGRVTNSLDCNDTTSAVRPTAAETCNDVDDDCDTQVDEGLAVLSYYPDGDGDGYGQQGATAQLSCRAVAGKVTNATDCNDANAAVKPLAPELCNTVDDDCDGATDEGLPTQSYWVDADSDGFGAAGTSAQVSCQAVTGRVTNQGDCNDANFNVKPTATESCNGADDDCDGATDEGNPGGGGACSTGQSGVCAAGVLTCTSGSVSCVRSTAPSTETCNALDDDCDGSTDEGFTGLGTACSAGVGVCRNTGTLVCNAAGTGTQCSATAGSPTAPACDGLDNDCDGTVDEPVLTSTSDVTTTPWSDLEVKPYYFSSGGCQGGALGTGTDALAGGALFMAGGQSGISLQRLTTAGAPTGSPSNFTSLTYVDVDAAQAGDGFVVAGVWSNNNAEVDLFYVDANGTQRTLKFSQFKSPAGCSASGTPCNRLDSLRVVRGNGRRVVVLWREETVGLRLAQVEACLSGTTWSLKAPGCASDTLTPVTLVASSAVLAGVAADSTHVDWAASQACAATSQLQRLAVAYSTSAPALAFFRVDENGANKSADTTAYSASAPRTLAEPDLAHFRDGLGAEQFLLAYVTRDPGASTPRADLNYWLTSDPTWHYAYLDYATENGADSILRPRASADATGLWLSAVRYVTDASGFKRQVMTRALTLEGDRTPLGSAVELSVTGGACSGAPECRPGDKQAFTNWKAFGRLYYSGSGATPAGSYASTLSCQ